MREGDAHLVQTDLIDPSWNRVSRVSVELDHVPIIFFEHFLEDKKLTQFLCCSEQEGSPPVIAHVFLKRI